MHRSIRFRVTALAVTLTFVALTSICVLIVALLRTQLTENLDESLNQRADTIAAVLPDLAAVGSPNDEDLLVQVVQAGRVAFASPNLIGAAPIVGPDEGVRNRSDIPGRTEHFRVLTRPVSTPAGPASIAVGANYDDVSDPVRIVTRLLAGMVPATAALLGSVTWWLTGRTLRPVERMRREMSAITATDLERRVPEPATGDEIDRLARTMNETLDRLEGSVKRQNRFIADASHELRGPLTRMRSELEVDLAQPASADHERTHRSVLDETIGLQRLVDELLHFARSDANEQALTPTEVELDDIVLREATRLREVGRVRVDTNGVTAVLVVGDRQQLRRAIANVVENAGRHARSRVTVATTATGGLAQVVVADDGPGVPPADRERVFERFARLDDARASDTGGSGLGLAITRDIVERHGGRISIDDDARFVIELPALA